MTIYQYLPEHFKTSSKTMLYRLLTAIDKQINDLEALNEFAANQFDYRTAEGQYLLNMAAKNGFSLPRFSGIGLDAFRKLAPIATTSPKQTLSTYLRLLEVFYELQTVRASMVSQIAGPYNVLDTDSLTISTQSSGSTTISIDKTFFENPNQVSASELASYINSRQNIIYADAVTERGTGQSRLRLTAPAYGVAETIAVTSGTLQNILGFNAVGFQVSSGAIFALSKPEIWSDRVTINLVSGTATGLFNLKKGDRITFRNLIDFPTTGAQLVQDLDDQGRELTTQSSISVIAGQYSNLNNTYEVSDSTPTTITFICRDFLQLTGQINIRSKSDCIATTSVPTRLFDSIEYATVSSTENGEVNFFVPAVPPIIRRKLEGSAHLRGVTVPVSTFTRTSLDLNTAQVPETIPNETSFQLYSNFFEMRSHWGSYKTTSNVGTIYSINADRPLPYTVNNMLSTNPIDAQKDGFIVNFGYKHGLREGWPFVLAGLTGAASVLNNQEFVTHRIISHNSVQVIGQFNLASTLTSTATITQVLVPRPDGAEIFATVPNPLDFIPMIGRAVKFQSAAVINSVQVWNYLLANNAEVISIDLMLNRVYMKTGGGYGVAGTVATGVTVIGNLPGIGGSSATYKMDLTTQLSKNILKLLTFLPISNIPPLTKEYVGAYLFNPGGSGYTVSKIQATLAEDIEKGSNDRLIQITGGEEFPFSGEIALSFGSDNQEGVIKYFSKTSIPSGSILQIDPSNVFQNKHLAGASVNIVASRSQITPREDGLSYQAYVTGIKATRDLIEVIGKKLSALGVNMKVEVDLPKLKFEDKSLKAFD